MRKLIALFACTAVFAAAASANDPPKGGGGVPTVETVKPAGSLPPAAAPAAGAHGGAAAPAPASAAAAGHGAAPAGAAPVSEAKSAHEPVAPIIQKPRPLTAAQLAAQRAKDDEAEADLSAKIAQRLAILRANQAARVAAAAKNKKDGDARKGAIAVTPPPKETHWTYEGEHGPANWGKINSDWAKCGTGTRQSPIDVRDGMKVDLEYVSFDYKASSFSVLDNGHTVQVTMTGGNYITVSNRMYELVQFHFHRPSEERLNGKGYEMVVHLVHRDAEGKLAVVAVLLERGKGNAMIQHVWNNLPLEKNDTVNPSSLLDPAMILPDKREYYTFMGSLTTPPCSEGVLWIVMKEPMQASPAQMALFSRLYPLNARPIQATSGRVIKESN